MTSAYSKYRERMTKIADISHAIGVLSWDKETYLPVKSDRFRSQQIATLSAMSHGEFTSPEFGDIIQNALAVKRLKAAERRNLTITLDHYQKAKKFDEAFVIEQSMAISKAFQLWVQAKKTGDFGLYAPALDDLIRLKIKESKILNFGDHPYDALLDQYEPNSTVAQLDKLFVDVRDELLPLIEKIREAKKPSVKFMHKTYKKDKQWDFGIYLLRVMGYDFDMGRQDISSHPFTISFSPEDVRVTTRIDDNDLANMTWSCLHEGGHALYEQGLNPEEYGLPSGGAISLAIHESQSRLWENHVGRSRDFWQCNYPSLQSKFKKNLKNVSLKDFYKAINKVEPNLIRTEADELHYHLHVLIRYEIEKEILSGNCDAATARELWNKKYKDYLGLKVKNDTVGILQDVHWSHGSFGYFPTYSMGSFYAAQFYQQAQKDMPDLNEQIAISNNYPLLQWLRTKIHCHGRSFEAEELCKKLTGEPLNLKYFIQYVKEKYGDLYNIDL